MAPSHAAGDKEDVSQELTAGILHTDQQLQPLHADQQQPALAGGCGQHHNSSLTAKRSVLQIAVLVTLLALLATVVGLAIGLSRSRAERVSAVDPACFHALGGGSVATGGSITSAAPEYCRAELAEYAAPGRGAYWREVEIAMIAAAATFGFAGFKAEQEGLGAAPATTTQQQQQQQQRVSGSGSGPVVARLSRSLLLAGAQQPLGAAGTQQRLGGPVMQTAAADGQVAAPPQPGRDKVIVWDLDETLLSNMKQILDPQTWPWRKWVDAAEAPALEPSRRFYRAACEAGYVLAFVTGRKEPSRNATMANLERAGYGRPCSDGPGPFYGLPASPPAAAAGSVSDSTECCYTALYMRTKNDTSLASVFKPRARQALLQRGNLTLVALLGDQLSDLNGEASAPYAFKLPNPFYYIL